MASFSHSTEPHRLFIDRYFEELLARGIQYFLPSSELTIVERSEEGKPELRSRLRAGGADAIVARTLTDRAEGAETL